MPSLLREIVASALATQSDFEIGEQQDRDFDVLLVCTGGGDEAQLALATMLRDFPPAIVALYAVLDRALARRGHARPPSRSPRAHLALLEAEGFTEVAVVREITEAYARARYAEGTLPDRATVLRLRKEAKRLSRRR